MIFVNMLGCGGWGGGGWGGGGWFQFAFSICTNFFLIIIYFSLVIILHVRFNTCDAMPPSLVKRRLTDKAYRLSAFSSVTKQHSNYRSSF